MRINNAKIHKIEYVGEHTGGLEHGYIYTVILVEANLQNGTEIHLFFQNGDTTKIIYDSFISFAKDWRMVKEIEFEGAYLPVKKG